MLELTPRRVRPGQDLSTLVAQTERFFKAGKSMSHNKRTTRSRGVSFFVPNTVFPLSAVDRPDRRFVRRQPRGRRPAAGLLDDQARRLASITYAHHRRGLEVAGHAAEAFSSPRSDGRH